MYGINCVICGTIPPVLLRRPWGLVDIQSLPPWAWCEKCGREVYRVGESLCETCGHYE